MALDFLAKCPTYARTTDPEILKRREMLLPFMNDNYKMAKGVPDKAIQTLGEHGIKTTKHVVGFDTAVYRNAFLFLTADAEEKTRLAERARKRTPEMGGVRCLMKDNIQTWEELFPKEAPGLALAPPTKTQESEDVVSFTKRQLAVLETGISKIREELARLEAERTLLAEENSRLKIENENLQASITTGEDRLRSLKALKVENLADQFPQVAALLELVTQPEPLAEGKDPATDLPKTCEPLGHKSMAYSENFLRQFSELRDKCTRGGVIKALKFFAKHGPQHSGLEARSLLTQVAGTKATNGYHIRAGRKRRLIYEVGHEEIKFTAIVLRGSKDLPYSER